MKLTMIYAIFVLKKENKNLLKRHVVIEFVRIALLKLYTQKTKDVLSVKRKIGMKQKVKYDMNLLFFNLKQWKKKYNK